MIENLSNIHSYCKTGNINWVYLMIILNTANKAANHQCIGLLLKLLADRTVLIVNLVTLLASIRTFADLLSVTIQ